MTGFSKQVRQTIAVRSSDYNTGAYPVCEVMAICQGVPATAVHHRRPRAAGGSRRPDTNQAANGLAVCDRCHFWCESHREKAFGFGWLVRQTAVPAEVQVLRRGKWVLLDNEGQIHPWPQRESA